MAPPAKDIAPDVNAKWLALRQKHQEDSNKFQREIAKNRAEFDARVEKARVALLEKHMSEERKFWGKNGNGSGAAKCAPSALKAARTPTRASTRTSTAAPKESSTPAARTSPSRPAVPRFEVDTPATPSKASQTVKSSKPPPTPTKPTRRPQQKGGKPVIIDLCGDSDDEKPLPSKKTSTAPKTAAPSAAQQKPLEVIQDSAMEGQVSPEQSHSRMSSVMPETMLELFGSGASTRSFATLTPKIKKEIDQQDSPQLNTSFRFPSMAPAKETHDLPSASPFSPFSPRASTAAPQSAQSAFSTPPAPEHGSRHDGALKTSSTSTAQRATSAVPASPQPSTSNGFAPSMNHRQVGGFSFGRTSSLGSFGQCTGLASPSSQGFGFSNRSHSEFSSPSAHNSEQGKSWESPFMGPVPLPVEEESSATVNKAHETINRGVANDPQTGREGFVEQCTRNTTGQDVEMTNTANADENTSLPVISQAATTPTLSTEHTSSSSTHPRGTFQKSQSAAQFRQSQLPAQQAWKQQLPSPPPSHASVVSEPATPGTPQASTAASTFKKPLLPASAESHKTSRQAIGSKARHVRAGTIDSRASSFTLPAEARTQRGASTTSRASNMSDHTGAASRKRKPTFDLSDDEDVSDYAPSEPDSPLAGKPSRLVEGHIVKKSKTSNGSSVASNVSSRVGQPVRKTPFGFKTTTPSKPKLPTASPHKTHVPTASATSKSSANRPASSTGRQPSPARTPTSAQAKSKPGPAAKKPQYHTSNSYFGKRAAAVKAEDKIHNIYQDTEEFATELAIEAADELEDARLPEDMGRMSITPAPQDAETVVMLATPPSKKRQRYHATVADEDDSEADINYDIRSDKSWRARR